MSDKQPEALRLADDLYCFRINDRVVLGAAAELRRLNALNAELVEALKLILDCPSGQYDTSDDYEIACDKANAALAKAKEVENV